ncbi:mannosyl-3-phosphoglycerate phosphatase [Atlantibacter hermannii]|nr:mannosyl-3-phosphoglycerate phosphatase [Atlantibacter hermannii]
MNWACRVKRLLAENGAVIQLNDEWDDHPNYPRMINGDSHESIRKVVNELRQTHGFKFTTYDDVDDAMIGEITGLTPKMIGLAKLQEASQTLIWRDSDERLKVFNDELNNLGLCMTEGGHFWHVLDQPRRERLRTHVAYRSISLSYRATAHHRRRRRQS